MLQKLDAFLKMTQSDEHEDTKKITIEQMIADSTLENSLDQPILEALENQTDQIEERISIAQDLIQYFLINYGILGIIMLILGFLIFFSIIFFGNLLKKRLKKTKLNQPQIHFIVQVFRFLGLLITVILFSFFLNFPVSSILTLLGAVVFVLSFALQGALLNFINGLLMVLLGYFDVGDLIETQGQRGIVEKIELFNTVLISPEGQYIILPNAKIAAEKVINISKQYELIFFTVKPENIEKIGEIREKILQILTEIPEILTDPSPMLRFKKKRQKFRINCWTTLDHHKKAKKILKEKLSETLKNENCLIKIRD